MLRILFTAVTLVLVQQPPSLSGEWSATIAAPRGVLEYTMYLNHEGPRLTGYFQSQYGEIPLKGTINGDEIRLTWTMMDGNKEIAVTMTGTVKGDAITGTAKLGTIGEGAFRADRAPGEAPISIAGGTDQGMLAQELTS